MTTELVPLTAPAPIAVPPPPNSAPYDLIALVLTGLKPQSQAGYRKDYACFARFAGVPSAEAALWALIRLEGKDANALALAYRSHLDARRTSPATCRRRLAALRRAVSRARMVGLCSYDLQVDAPRAEAFRDTAGPGRKGWEKMLAFAAGQAEAGGSVERRNLAIVLLLHDRALRRGEVAALDFPVDVDPQRPAVQILGKGKTTKEWVTINDRTLAALAGWITARTDWPGPLFVRSDRAAREPTRMTGDSINRMVKALAARCGLVRTVRAHGLRHSAITEALDGGWDVRDVKAFSRHAKIDTVLIYDDRRKDIGGEITQSLSRPKRRSRRGS